MESVSRRKFVRQALLASGALVSFPVLSWGLRKAAFKISLNPGAIGVSLSNEELLAAAIAYQFKAIVPNVYAFGELPDQAVDQYFDQMGRYKISWGAIGLPIEFRQSEQKFESDLRLLNEMLPRIYALGITRMSTWIMPCHDELDYKRNMVLHAARLRKTAELLAPYNIRLGLEYVGPKTLKESKRYPFVSNLEEVQELIAVIGRSNVGVQLDAFHWYCAGESQKDLLSLTSEEIITVDLNDAKAGRSREEQLDWERELPGSSGVIDLSSFLEALVSIGYDGPIRAEPFNAKLNEMENAAALNATSKAMQAAFKLID